MSTPRSLPIRLAPLPGEAIDSWLEALAHRNHTDMVDLLAAVRLSSKVGPSNGARWIVRVSPTEIASICAATGLEPEEVAAMTLSHYDGRALQIDLDKPTVSRAFPWGRGVGSRYCPDCLTETGGRWQLVWRLGWSFACLRHHCLLADTCPECARPQRMLPHVGEKMPIPGRCARPGRDATGRTPQRCGAPLTSTTVARFDPGHPALVAQQILYRVIDSGAAYFGVYRELGTASRDLLTDVRAVAGRILHYATDGELKRILPADLVGPYRKIRTRRTDSPAAARDKPGLYTPAEAVTAAVGATAAVTILNTSTAAEAGAAARWLIRGGRDRGFAMSPTSIGWSSRVTPTLTAVQLAALGPDLKLGDQLRYRIGAPWPTRPAPGKTRLDTLSRGIPTMLWPQWSLRLSIPGCRHRYFRRVISAALLLVGTTLTMDEAAQLSSPDISGSDISRILQLLQNHANWEAVRAALTSCADMLAEGHAPIDYRRRRKLDYAHLLPDRDWDDICRRAGVSGKLRYSAQRPRCFLFEQLTGMPAGMAPYARSDWEFRSGVADFPRTLTPELHGALGEYAQRFLAEHDINNEPTVWHPPTAVLDDLGCAADPTDGIDIVELHRLIRRDFLSVPAAAKHLHTTTDVVRHVLEQHPAPTPEPVLHPKPPPRPPRRPRSPSAYQQARARLTRAKFVELYEGQRMPLAAIGASVGVSRGTVTRLAHDYGIALREAGNRDRCQLDKNWLHTQYVEQRRSIQDIAEEREMSSATVARWLADHNIPIRPSGGVSHTRSPQERRIIDGAPLLRPAMTAGGGWERLTRFADSAHYPTLSAAAADLGFSPSRLVIQIKQLESDFDQPLIIRAERGRPMQITDFGAQVIRTVHKARLREPNRL